jgi:1-hydroxycarotenoid 3,4-desaturase
MKPYPPDPLAFFKKDGGFGGNGTFHPTFSCRRPTLEHPILIIGAGAGGLTAAITLAAAGLPVTILERAETPGGKIRQLPTQAGPIDAGPTVFTMRWVFEEIFAAAGSALTNHVTLHPLPVLARHSWGAGPSLDLFADLDASIDAIGRFAGARDAAGYRRFAARAQRIYATLETPFLRAQQPGSPLALVRRAGVADMLGIAAFSSLWRELGRYFTDPRLRQLFARYSTYCGSSPYLAPATLMLIAHVERDGVWIVQGGMKALADALASLAMSLGVTIRYGAQADAIETTGGRATALRLADGEILPAAAMIMAADAAALTAGLFGPGAAWALPPPGPRSLSALTWATAADVSGFALHHHNVFFGAHYRDEFDAIFTRARLPADPTIYVCAQDRGATDASPDATERLLLLVNAPPTGDTTPPTEQEIATCQDQMLRRLAQSGLHLQAVEEPVLTGPAQFNALFPGTGGALYGGATHGTQASFRRPGSRTLLPGLYLAGGSAHPGAGVPMAALSGRLAAASVLEDLISARPSRMAATRGGMSTR